LRRNVGLSFDGIDDYVEVSNSTLWSFGDESFTLEALARNDRDFTPDETDMRFLLAAGYIGGVAEPRAWGLGIGWNPAWQGINNPCINFFTNDGVYHDWCSEVIRIETGKLYHYALVVDRSVDKIRFYQNGIGVGELDYVFTTNANYNLLVGRRFSISPTTFTEEFAGAIGLVRIYERALSDEEVFALYSYVMSPTIRGPSSLVG